jgi:3-dehydroquinate dehydratase/shikimate dehydrogenase
MICISVTPESRQLAKVDILNAARQCDLVEVCLDHLIKEPDISDLLQGVTKPVILSCRRAQDGGKWTGTEEERMLMLRQAIVAGPEWVELEIDVADKVPRFGKTKRLVSFTRLDKPLGSIDAIVDRAVGCKADAVKFTGPTPTLDASWPLLSGVTKKRDIPVVGMGVGRPGLTFSLLGLKYGSPWVYAALEKGMETYDGQATVTELTDVYRWKDIGPQTRFVAVSGFERTETMTVRIMNAGFASLGINVRCLPLELDRLDSFAQMLEVLKIHAVLPDSRLGNRILSVIQQSEESVRMSQFTDLLLKQTDGWHAYNSLWRGALKALEDALGRTAPDDRPLDHRNVMLIGAASMARTLAYGVHRRKGLLSVAAADDERAQLLAQMFEIRFVPIANIYGTLCDVLIVTGEAMQKGQHTQKLSAAYLRPNMTVMDLSNLPGETEILSEARNRGCKVVEPSSVYVDQLSAQFKAITGQDLPVEAFQMALDA